MEQFNMKSQGGLSDKKSDELTKAHNTGNVLRDFNGNSHLGAKFLNYQQEYKKMRELARKAGRIQ